MQKSFPDLEYAAKKKLTRRDRFLAEIDNVTPWGKLHKTIEPFYPKVEGAGRPPIGLARMLRMYVAQQCFGLSDEGIEDAIYDSQSIRAFVGIDLGRGSAPDATTLLKFCHLLEANGLTRHIFDTVNGHLADKGLMMREGTIVDATLIAAPPEGYSLGGQVALGAVTCGLLMPPTSQEAQNQLVYDRLALKKVDPSHEKYHGIFLSHTGVDKPFVRRLRKDLLAHGVERVWLDEAEIDIGDSLIAKIEEGIKLSRYIAVGLSNKSINAPWVRKELDVAMNREIASGEIVVLPPLYEECQLPEFLKGRFSADFLNPEDYEAVLGKLLRRLRIA